MADVGRPTLPVHVEIPDVWRSVLEEAGSDLAAALEEGARALATELGCPVDVSATVGTGPGNWPVVRVGEHACLPSSGALLRTASAQPPSEVRDRLLRQVFPLWDVRGSERGLVDVGLHGDAQERALVLLLLSVDLPLGTLRRRPELFVTEDVARAWRLRADPESRWPERWDSAMLLRAVLAAGLRADLDEEDAASLTAAAVSGSGAEEAVQWLVSHAHTRVVLVLELAPDVLEQLEPELAGLEAVDAEDERLPQAFRTMWAGTATYLGELTGVLVPALRLAAVPSLPSGTVRVRIGTRALEPVPVPLGGTRLFTSVPEIPGARPTYLSAGLAGQIAASDGDGTALAHVLPLAVLADCRQAMHLMLHAEQVAYRLSQIDDIDPRLVDHVLDTVALAELTLILRGLVAAGHGITDLPSVLAAVVEAATLPISRPGLVALDPRPLVAATGGGASRWQRLLAGVLRTEELRMQSEPESIWLRSQLVPPAVQRELETAWLGSGTVTVAADLHHAAGLALAREPHVLALRDLARPLAARELIGYDPPVRFTTSTGSSAAPPFP